MQQIYILTFFLLVLILPLLLWASSQRTQINSRAAAPITPPNPTSTIQPNSTPTLPVTPPIPSSTLTPSPIATLTPTVTSFPTTTTSPTITPTPKINNSRPVIITAALLQGKLMQNYRASVRGYDRNTEDELTMTFTNLPPGLMRGICLTAINPNKRKNIRCTIEGVPTKTGVYNVRVLLTDNWGGSAYKTIWLTIAQ